MQVVTFPNVSRLGVSQPANCRTPLVFVIISSPAKSEAAGLPRETKLPSRDLGPATAPDTPSVAPSRSTASHPNAVSLHRLLESGANVVARRPPIPAPTKNAA